jgi:predicted phage baseplate assembly protein
VLPASLGLAVEGDLGIELWRQVDDLAGLPYGERAFTLDPAAGTVTFGGPEGARPEAGRRIFASYEYGGGLEGNVAIGAIKTSTDPGVAGFVIENPIATWGGDLAETVVEAERTLPAVLRHRDRLVTDKDFRDVTMRTPGVDVGRVEVLSLFKPDAPSAEAAGVVTVMVVPHFDSARPRWPTPDRLFLRTVCDYLDVRRLVTTELYVRGPIYLDTWVTIGISTAPGWFPDIVRQAVRNRMYEYLSSLPPGGAAGGGWELGRTILKKDLEAVATRVPGVAFVRSIRLGVTSGEDVDSWAISGLELPLLRNIGVVEGEAEPLASVIAGGAVGTPVRQVPVPVDPEAC